MKIQDLEKMLSETAASSHWQNIGVRQRHGIAIPLSALHSKKSCGIGEFCDLIPLIDWCHEIDLQVIQLLPLNDSGNDPSPYNALSSCALHPIYLSLGKLPYLDHPDLNELQQLTNAPRVLYHEILNHKMFWLRQYFEKVKTKLTHETDFKNFAKKNRWVEPYALFKVLKDLLKGENWVTWPKDLKILSPKQYNDLIEKHRDDLSFYTALQYLCYKQLQEVKKHANSRGVLLKGDVPILISKDSVDAWHYSDIFDLSLSAGAPPDTYNQEGQYWGFPLFKWDVLKQKQYTWWKQRLEAASNLYDLYRIDHVVGFFRIWGIANNRPPKEGKFYPEAESLWKPLGMELLQMLLKSSPMLPIAEDLGVVPPVVRTCLTQLGICGTKVMRWERMWDEDKRFISIENYSPISMTCVSTHDSDTLQLWWKNYAEEAKAFAQYKHWEYTPDLTVSQRKEILWDSHHTASLFHINLLQEYLALFPDLSWQNPEDERINEPGKTLPTNWTYRLRPTLEELLSHESLKAEIKKLISP